MKQSLSYRYLPSYLRVLVIVVVVASFSFLAVFVSARNDNYYTTSSPPLRSHPLFITGKKKTIDDQMMRLREHNIWMMMRGGAIGGGRGGGGGSGSSSSKMKNDSSSSKSQQQQGTSSSTASSSSSSSSSKVNVSPDGQLPSSMEDVSIAAFKAPIPVPTATDSNDDYDYYDTTTTTTTAASKERQESIVEEPSSSTEDEDILEGQYSTISSPSSPSSKLVTKLKNVQERTGPAILMLVGIGLWSYYLKEDGLILLTFLLQIGMYNEMTFVIGGDFTSRVNKWWWFLTGFVGFNLPRMFPWKTTEIMTLSYGMSIIGILGSIINFNSKKSNVDEFREYLRQAAVSFLSMLLVVAPTSFWISTLEEFGMNWIIYSLALVIINDTMAYVFGMSLGKHPMLPSISPKKTWEGFVGAAISTIAVAIHWLPFKDMQLTKNDALIISGFVSLIAPFGGYLASVIKRAYGQKDFGNFIPGHGGFVDRLDCQVFMAPFLYLYLAITRNEDKSVEDLLTQMADKIIP